MIATTLGSTPSVQVKIRPARGLRLVDVKELWEFRELLWSLAIRDLKVRYKQTVLGVAWVVLLPLMGAGILTFVFGMIAGFDAPQGVPYFLVSYSGMIGWSLFSTTLNKAGGSLVGNSSMIAKIYFPRLLLPLSTAGSALVDLAVAMVVFAAVLLVTGVWPSPIGLLLLPVWLGILLMLSMAVGLVTASLSVQYRDVRHVMPAITQLLLYASPVAYRLSDVNERVPEALRTVYMLNPLASILEAVRWSLIGVGELNAGYVAYSAAVSVLALAAALAVFSKLEERFADVI